MTRVSENSGKFALNQAISQTKRKLEDLQLKGSTLKKIVKPSDDPAGNIDYLTLGSRVSNKEQFIKNSQFAQSYLEYTEDALVEITDILNKTKELAIAQSSDFYNEGVRKNVSKEMIQLREQLLAIGNRRIGNRYLFGGYATLQSPFNALGEYRGDQGKISVEVSKDFFVPINLHGAEIFNSSEFVNDEAVDPLEPFPQLSIPDDESPEVRENLAKTMGGKNAPAPDRAIAEETPSYITKDNIFGIMNSLIAALENSDPKIIQAHLEDIDEAQSRVITLRTRVGAIYNSVLSTRNNIEKSKISDLEQRSQIADADVAELYSDIIRQQNVLQATYKSGQNIINKTLLDFL